MSVSRISSSFLVDRNVFNLQQNLMLMNKLQERVASGRNITFPSDDPIALTQLLRLNTEISEADRFTRNITDGLAEMSVTENALTSLVDIVTRARELAVKASNGANSSEQLIALNAEVQTLINQAIQIGNTSYVGRNIFSGFKTDTQPFTQAGSDISYNGSSTVLLGEPYERKIQVGRGAEVTVNLPGDQIFGTVAVVAGVPTAPPGEDGIFYALTKLKVDIDDVINGTGSFDTVRTNIDLLKSKQEKILEWQTTLGSRINQLEMTYNRYQDRNIIQAEEMARIQDINLPEAISSLNFQQNIFETSMFAMGKIMQTSLVNFLR